jgi:hypothetical protein
MPWYLISGLALGVGGLVALGFLISRRSERLHDDGHIHVKTACNCRNPWGGKRGCTLCGGRGWFWTRI